MSHVGTVDCFVTDLADAAAGGEACGFELRQNQRSYTWYGQYVGDSQLAPGHDPATFGTCEHVLRLKDHREGDYEIGLVPRVDGEPGWELLYDSWGPGSRIEARAGQRLAKLKDEIAAAASERVLRRQGYRVTRTVNAETGAIQVRGTR